MKDILLIPVGGTICTALNQNGALSVDGKAGEALKQGFETSDSPLAGEVRIHLTDNLMILSENMTVDKWNVMLDAFRTHTQTQHYDGVIFAHGTDTLAYSAALFAQILSGTDIPVMFVSANARLDSDRSNGHHNFRKTVECIGYGITPNVYAVYRNISDGVTFLHLASRLEQCPCYSDDFHSVGAIDISGLDQNTYAAYMQTVADTYPSSERKNVIDVYGDWHLSDDVLILEPYVGLRYDTIDFSHFRAVLHTTYHSGTVCAQKTDMSPAYGPHSVLYMIDRCAETETDVYVSPAKLNGETYETVHTLAEQNVWFLYGATKEATYAKLLLAYTLMDTPAKRLAYLRTQQNFEMIYAE